MYVCVYEYVCVCVYVCMSTCRDRACEYERCCVFEHRGLALFFFLAISHWVIHRKVTDSDLLPASTMSTFSDMFNIIGSRTYCYYTAATHAERESARS